MSSLNGRRLFWSLTLLYALASAIYAMAILVGVLLTGTVEESLAVPVVMLGHVLLFLLARNGWDRFSDNRWEGLLRASEGTQRLLRAVIRLFGGLLLLVGVLLVLAVGFLEFRLAPEGADRLAALGVAAAILFGSLVYGSCSLFGGESIASRDPSLWEQLLTKVGRARLRRNRGRE